MKKISVTILAVLILLLLAKFGIVDALVEVKSNNTTQAVQQLFENL